jgi:hypothetical protein
VTFITKDWQDAPSEETPLDAPAREDLETRLSDYTDAEVAAEAAARAAADEALDARVAVLEGDTTAISEVAGLQAALDALQASATAATDSELADAVATLNASIAGKQDSAAAATDAELAAAVATINSSLAAKQDASGAATDAELASAVATINTAIAARRRVVAAGNLGATPSLAVLPSDEDVALVGTLTANATLTITGLLAGQSVRLLLTQDATGGRTLSITVGGSTAAVTVNPAAGSTSVVTGFYDGTDLYVRGA